MGFVVCSSDLILPSISYGIKKKKKKILFLTPQDDRK